jgi:hypothetical protein
MVSKSDEALTGEKRPFERVDGVLFDEWTAPDGTKASLRLPASLLGKEPTHEERENLLERAPTDSMATYALSGDESEEVLQALLDGLDTDAAQPGRLVRWADDPGVRPALHKALRKRKLGTLANFAQVVGRLGGEGAVELLREKLDALLSCPYADEKSHADEVYASDVHAAFNLYAFDLVVVAHAVLRLDPDAMDAARALEELILHPCEGNRLHALEHAAKTVNETRTLQTEAVRLLRRSLEPLLESDDPTVFLEVARGFVDSLRDDGMIHRAIDLLRHDDSGIRRQAVSLLQAVPAKYAARVRHSFGKLFAGELDLRESVGMAVRLAALVPDEDRVELARQAFDDASPSLRWEGLLLLEGLAAEDAREIAERAHVDEPDTALRSKLEPFCAGVQQ